MKVVNTVYDLQKHLKELSLSPVALIPTMGALHEGHISLVNNGIQRCPVIVVSIFVNPTQFNDKNDLRNYPRTPEADLELLRKIMREEDIVFIPAVQEIYPEEDKRKFSFGNLDKVMEALHRPGHFNGVAQVVTRLFDIIKPDIAIFGMKDFQQLAVVKSIVKQTGNKVKIIGSPIVREKDGLAMSSRNQLLEPAIRKRVPVIYKTISAASEMIAEKDIPEIKSFVSDGINSETGLKVEYFEIVDDLDLSPLQNKTAMRSDRQYFGCIAVQAGNIRLIDNIHIELVLNQKVN
jgi:pantoate--beta-alanine ligase